MKKILTNLLIISIIILFFLRLFNNNLYIIYKNYINYICILSVIISSTYFTIKLKGINFNLKIIKETIINSKKEDIKALFLSMGAKIGVGSIAGISISIYLYGPGILLWIWIITLLSSILTYCETYLGCIYNNKGVFYYIKEGINNNRLAITYTLLLLFIYEVGFVGIQTNTIYKSISKLNLINDKFLIIVIMLVIIILLFNKTNKIINIISRIVPLMCIIYIIACIPLLLKINNIIEIFKEILLDGLQNNSLSKIIIVGLQRGIFATESGIGTSSITTNISKSNPQKQGLFQVLGVHFISLVIITLTGLIIIANKNMYQGKIDGIEILIKILSNYYGIKGNIILCIVILLFALSTILSSYYYSQKGIKFIYNKKEYDSNFIKIIIIIFSFLGMIIKSSIIWSILDSLIIFLLLINIYSMIKLRKKIR